MIKVEKPNALNLVSRKFISCYNCKQEVGNIHLDYSGMSGFLCIKCNTHNSSMKWIEDIRIVEAPKIHPNYFSIQEEK